MQLKMTIPGLPESITLPQHAVIIGDNGKGKTSLLNAAKAAISGSTLGGGKLSDISKTATSKASVSGLTTVDLREISGFTGVKRADTLCTLLNAKVDFSEAISLVEKQYQPHNISESSAIQAALRSGDIDKAIKIANREKKDYDSRAKALKGSLAVPEVSHGELCKLLGLAEKKLKESDKDLRAPIMQELEEAKEELGGYEGDLLKAEGDLRTVKDYLTDARDEIKFPEDELQKADADVRHYQIMHKAVEKVSNCPTCGQSIDETHVERIKGDLTAAQEKQVKFAAQVKKLRTRIDKLNASYSKGTRIIETLKRIASLRGQLAETPEGGMSADEVKELENVITEYRNDIKAHEQSMANSKTAEDYAQRASRYRATESALKKLKGAVAERAGFPMFVTEGVKAVLGWKISFGKVGNSMNILITDANGTRPIDKISAGEWQIIAALVGCINPDAVVLAEVAEIDDKRLEKLQAVLSEHEGYVFLADCHGRNPEGWEVVNLEQ